MLLLKRIAFTTKFLLRFLLISCKLRVVVLKGVFFKLTGLSCMCKFLSKKYHNENVTVNKTRLKENILSKFKKMKTFVKETEDLLAFEKDVGHALASACSDMDTIQLARTAEIALIEICFSINCRLKKHLRKLTYNMQSLTAY